MEEARHSNGGASRRLGAIRPLGTDRVARDQHDFFLSVIPKSRARGACHERWKDIPVLNVLSFNVRSPSLPDAADVSMFSFNSNYSHCRSSLESQEHASFG